mgnify:FL=1
MQPETAHRELSVESGVYAESVESVHPGTL